MVVLEEKNIKDFSTIIEKYSFKELCDGLDKRKEQFELSGKNGKTVEEIWDNYLDRNNTFLTVK